MTRHVPTKHGRKLAPLAMLIGLATGASGALLLQQRVTEAQTRAPAPATTPSVTIVHLTK